MSNMRPELSSKNKYWIPKNRYYELKYFCLQYGDYKTSYDDCIRLEASLGGGQKNFADPTAGVVIRREKILAKMKKIEQAAIAADPELSNYIFEAVTAGVSYTYLSMVKNMPCGKNTFYDRYRKFFWILDASFSNPIIE